MRHNSHLGRCEINSPSNTPMPTLLGVHSKSVIGLAPDPGKMGGSRRAKLTELGLTKRRLMIYPLVQVFNPGVAGKHRFKTDLLVKLLP
jgi:hypothetical protein